MLQRPCHRHRHRSTAARRNPARLRRLPLRTWRHLLLLHLHIAEPPLVCIALVVQLVPLAGLQHTRAGGDGRGGAGGQV
jgi:hypothetical protein